jgi:hypothetical protein
MQSREYIYIYIYIFFFFCCCFKSTDIDSISGDFLSLKEVQLSFIDDQVRQ